ncbi:DUF1588 domain-containing protein [Stieleria sp. ICT_E10.1]|uniref:DUF1588 domain-containing protein n=1 Tax=Stieleria sedimenti TaxID=2976331 RepID=UPI0021801C03|nr:DUF1588 domain-containing protein [Stieleria sedimenti]MCS7468797.1 DUF1588 domain-containing protein [Stieleria sedimenti]
MFSLGMMSSADAETYTPGQPLEKDYESFAGAFLADHCIDCHGETAPEGGLSLQDLGPVDEINAGTWRSVWAQVSLQEMPPPDASELGVVDRLQFSDWIVDELSRVMRDKGGFHDHRDPNKGNFIDHDLLFGALPEEIRLVPTSSPARIWRVTPQEHITRLNELINTEPEYDPEKPGLRTHGDVVPTNHGGELKLYFGVDRIIKWQGGTVAYATSVKSVPAILSSARKHGLENYPDFYTVNSAEATQILDVADDIIRYMAEGPLSIAQPYQITDDPASIADKMVGDLRGLPTSLVYSTKVVRPLTPVYDLMKEDGVTDQRVRGAVEFLFEALTYRPPTDRESNQYLQIVNESIQKLGKEDGAVLGLSSIFLDRDALFRPELVEYGSPDPHGRVMLQDWELGLAVNHALRYIRPDDELRTAVLAGRMRTRDDVRREVQRMLADDSIRKPRILQFFRDYFDYDLGGYICKDNKALAETGVNARGVSHYRAMFDATASTDRLVELILHEDKDVLKQLLTTDKVVATKTDEVYFGRKRTPEETAAAAAEAKRAAAEETKEASAALKSAKKELAAFEQSMKANPDEDTAKKQRELTAKERAVSAAEKKLAAINKRRRDTENHSVDQADLSGPNLFARVSRRSFGNGSMKPERVLATAPEGQRLGILTHPSWLVSHSDAMDNHAILRGRWVRERLLGGGIPDVPITVDAMLPDEPHSTLRERMRVTRETYCWTCHEKMDPLGLPFEMYNHAGLYRTLELDKPVDTTGEIIDSGDPELDGEVADAIEMIQKLAESERAEQVFVRHAFRFWMGRNETLHDAPVLQDAHRAYKESGGSMNALITSLLTSDAFLYRTRTEPGMLAESK